MNKSTIYCSKCGKGNIIEAPTDGFRFRCINCNELNQIQAKKPAGESISKRLREVYQRSQQGVGTAAAGRSATNIRHKKTLVDRNIDLLEKVESMEKETLEIKNEYLEMTRQLSLKEAASSTVDQEQLKEIKTEISKVSEISGKINLLDEIKELVKNLQQESSKAIDFSELKSFFQTEMKAELDKLPQADVVLDSLQEIKEMVPKESENNLDDVIKETLAKEFKSMQHMVNTIAGEVRLLRKDLSSMASALDSISAGNAVSAPAVSSSASISIPIVPEKTTQILAIDGLEEASGEQKASSTAKKGSRSFKAVSEKLKSLKL